MIEVRDVSKSYRIFRRGCWRVLDALGFPVPEGSHEEFWALRDVSLTVPRGQRLGIIGRNGAGKSTLVKMMAGLAQPTAGTVRVDGRVQTLMELGTGFHPEFTGRDNVLSALAYQGVTGQAARARLEEILEFSELGEFIDRPLKGYSAGMQARLAFSVATAMIPDILVVDEVLSAGDAYFSAKCSERMRRLTGEGRTLLLVSHSMQQVLQFCERTIWLDAGRVVMDGDSLEVIKAYEAFVYRLRRESAEGTRWLANLEPGACPVPEKPARANGEASISRWVQHDDVVIAAVRTLGRDGDPRHVFDPGEPFAIQIHVAARRPGEYQCRAAVMIFAADGTPVVRHRSETVRLVFREDEMHCFEVCYEKLLLGSGAYLFSAAIFETLEDGNEGEAIPYEIHSRSYEFKVASAHAADPSRFLHPARWKQWRLEPVE